MVSGRIERDGGGEREKEGLRGQQGYEFLYYTKIINLFGSIWQGWDPRGVEGRKEGGAVVEESWKGLEERGSSRRGVCPKLGGVANRACKHAHAAFPWDEAALYARYNTALKTYTLLPFS